MEEFILQVAKEAGQLVLKRFKKNGVTSIKSHAQDLLTEADVEANDFIVNAIKKQYTDHGIISEEAADHQQKAEYMWYVDPLDGTFNFSHDVPLFATMMALAHNGELQLAAIYDPSHDELFFAKRNGGASLNGEKIYCSTKHELTDTWGISTSRFSQKSYEIFQAFLKYPKNKNIYFSNFSSSAINAVSVAAGRRDWLISRGAGAIWDYAAPVLILKESGCTVTTLQGKPWELGDLGMLAANPMIHAELLKVLSA